MNRSELLDWINQIEQRYPVDEWKINELHLWPYLRMKLSFHLVRVRSPEAAESPDAVSLSLWEKISLHLTSAKKLAICLLRSRQTDFVFLGSFSQRVKHRHSWYNRFFDPVIEDLEQEGYRCSRLEYGKANNEHQGIPLYRESDVLHIEEHMPLLKLWQRIKNRFEPACPSPTDYHSFLLEVAAIPELNGILASLSITHLRRELTTITAYRAFFRLYFTLTRPYALIVLSYYSPAPYGAIAAANAMNLCSIDIQHGPQTGVHPAYNRFMRIPSTGYNLLPRLFWVWEATSQQGLIGWTNQYHQVREWGHPWVQYWLSQKENTSEQPDKPSVPLILYSLQPMGELLDEYILVAMQESHQYFHWCLRVHPRQQHMLEAIARQMTQAGLDGKITIDDGLSTPLPRILTQTAVHLTRFSGTAIEAALLHVPTLFLDPFAEKLFHELIKTGQASVLNTHSAEALLQQIEIIVSRHIKVKPTFNHYHYADLLSKELSI